VLFDLNRSFHESKEKCFVREGWKFKEEAESEENKEGVRKPA